MKAALSSPLLALWEVGGLIDERQVNGAKVWKREKQPASTLFLYVLNNYWQYNYKADREGLWIFQFSYPSILRSEQIIPWPVLS